MRKADQIDKTDMHLEPSQPESVFKHGRRDNKEPSMGIRETINQSRYMVAGVAVAAIVVAGGFIVSAAREGSTPGYAKTAFYSDDDGVSYFEDSNKLIPPFEHRGKQAYAAHVFSCDNGKTKWVGYLEGYRPDAREKMIEVRALMDQLAKDPNAAPPPPEKDPMYVIPAIQRKGLVIKPPDKPGQPPNKWVCQADGSIFTKLQQPECPDGKNGALMEILP